jgi:hypothetical protein
VEERSTEELLAKIVNVIERLKTAINGDDDYPLDPYTFVPVEPKSGYVVDGKRNGYSFVGDDVIAWRINHDGTEVRPVTPDGVVAGEFHVRFQ